MGLCTSAAITPLVLINRYPSEKHVAIHDYSTRAAELEIAYRKPLISNNPNGSCYYRDRRGSFVPTNSASRTTTDDTNDFHRLSARRMSRILAEVRSNTRITASGNT